MRWFTHGALLLAGLMFWLLFSGPAATQDISLDVRGQIAYLLDFIRASPCTFIRNGAVYRGPAAADHIAQKYNYYKDEIHSAEDFIKLRQRVIDTLLRQF